MVFFQQFPVPGEVGPALCPSFHAFSGDAFKVLNVYGGRLLEVVHHGFCQRMFRELLQTIENVRQRIACSGASTGRHCLRIPYQFADYRFSFGHRSGLVEYDGVYLLGNLQAFGIFYQNAPFGALPMPTMMAVGVASPSAHGQAMMTTVTNASNPWVNPPVPSSSIHAMKASTAML